MDHHYYQSSWKPIYFMSIDPVFTYADVFRSVNCHIKLILLSTDLNKRHNLLFWSSTRKSPGKSHNSIYSILKSIHIKSNSYVRLNCWVICFFHICFSTFIFSFFLFIFVIFILFIVVLFILFFATMLMRGKILGIK